MAAEHKTNKEQRYDRQL
ncbi:uncharacterized, partial [Tachysurus ichikawai]